MSSHSDRTGAPRHHATYRVLHKATDPISPAAPMRRRGTVRASTGDLYDYGFTPASLQLDIKPLGKAARNRTALNEVRAAVHAHYAQPHWKRRGSPRTREMLARKDVVRQADAAIARAEEVIARAQTEIAHWENIKREAAQ